MPDAIVVSHPRKSGQSMTDDRSHHDAGGPTNYAISIEVKVLTERVANLTSQVKERADNTDRKLDNVLANFATKIEVKEVSDDLEKLKSILWWIVKIILGTVATALLSLVVGVLHK
jgi:hypothetical protein